MVLKEYVPSQKNKNPKKRQFLFTVMINKEELIWAVEDWDEESPTYSEECGFQIVNIYELPELKMITPPDASQSYSEYQEQMEQFWYNK